MPTTEETGRLGAEALALQTTCLAALSAIGIHPEHYLYPGLPPVEVGAPPCDGMLAIYVPNLGRLPTNIGGGPLANMPTGVQPRAPMARYTVIYAQCVDVWGDTQSGPPPASSLTDQALIHMTAGWVLMNGIYHAVQDDRLFAKCLNWSLGDLTPLAVTGQSAGWTFDVTIQLDGFNPYA